MKKKKKNKIKKLRLPMPINPPKIHSHEKDYDRKDEKKNIKTELDSE